MESLHFVLFKLYLAHFFDALHHLLFIHEWTGGLKISDFDAALLLNNLVSFSGLVFDDDFVFFFKLHFDFLSGGDDWDDNFFLSIDLEPLVVECLHSRQTVLGMLLKKLGAQVLGLWSQMLPQL